MAVGHAELGTLLVTTPGHTTWRPPHNTWGNGHHATAAGPAHPRAVTWLARRGGAGRGRAAEVARALTAALPTATERGGRGARARARARPSVHALRQPPQPPQPPPGAARGQPGAAAIPPQRPSSSSSAGPVEVSDGEGVGRAFCSLFVMCYYYYFLNLIFFPSVASGGGGGACG